MYPNSITAGGENPIPSLTLLLVSGLDSDIMIILVLVILILEEESMLVFMCDIVKRCEEKETENGTS